MRIALLLLLSAGLSFGAISRDGSCSTSGTSCTLSATATGSLKLIFAYRSSSTTPPSLPGSYTQVATGSTAAGGQTGAWLLYCSVATGSGDTGTGTATNASGVAAVSYAGTSVGTTGNCNSTGVAGSRLASNLAKTSTTASYDGITLVNAGNIDWVAGFLGTSPTTTCTPAGMTQVAAGTGSGERTVSDTNGTVSSWSTTTCSVSSGTWMTVVIEILQTLAVTSHNTGFIGTQ